jgi:hypothetical protein
MKQCSWLEEAMVTGSKEYLLEELLEHPILAVQMTSEGIERRCVDLMFDTMSGLRRFVEVESGEMLAGSFAL